MAWRNWRKVSSLRFPQTEADYVSLFPSNYEHLKAFDARLGKYEGDFRMLGTPVKGPMAFSTAWSLNKNFVEALFTGDSGELMFIINGWNPNTKSVQSWNFNADGTRGEGVETVDADGSGSAVGTVIKADGTVLKTRREHVNNSDGTFTAKGFDNDEPTWDYTFQELKK